MKVVAFSSSGKIVKDDRAVKFIKSVISCAGSRNIAIVKRHGLLEEHAKIISGKHILGLYLPVKKTALLKEIVIALQSYQEAHLFLRRYRLRAWVIMPGIVYALLFITGMYFFWTSADEGVYWMSRKLGIEAFLQKERSPFLSFLFVMTGMMLRLMLVFLYFSLFKYLILIVGSPVFALLSEKTEAALEGKEHHWQWQELRKDCSRSIRVALRNAGRQSVYLLGLLLLSLVPVIGWITPVIALLMECFYYGASMLDYSFARHGYSPSQSIYFTGRHKGLAIGNGILFYIMHLVVIFAPAYAVIAATLTVQKVKST